MEVVLEHAVPGRIRLRLPALRTRRTELSRLQHRLETLPGIRRVASNPRIGGLTVTYDRRNKHALPELTAALPDINVQAFRKRLMRLASTIASSRRPRARWVRLFVGRTLTFIHGHSNEFDARYLLPASMVLLAIREFLRTRKPVPWYNLLWYSYSLFHSLNWSAENPPLHPEIAADHHAPPIQHRP